MRSCPKNCRSWAIATSVMPSLWPVAAVSVSQRAMVERATPSASANACWVSPRAARA
ncbi:hypothetical protein [Caudoviricetes sp.]|nr:hypothetical protein [Caudoviricetes sp.]